MMERKQDLKKVREKKKRGKKAERRQERERITI